MYRLVNSPAKQEGYTGSYCELYTAYEVDNLLTSKQNTLTAGQGIGISGDTISININAIINDTLAQSNTTYSSAKIDDLIANIEVEPYTVQDPLRIDGHIIKWPSVNITSGVYGSATEIPILTLTDYGLVSDVDKVTVYPPTSIGSAGQYWKSKGTGIGEWTSPDTQVTESSALLITSGAVYEAIQQIQVPTYTAGNHISIDTNNVISSNQINDIAADTETTYSSTKINTLLGAKQDKLLIGNNISITGNKISSNQIDDTTDSLSKTYSSNKIENLVSGKQDTLTAGTGININGTLISCTLINDSSSSVSKTYSSSKINALLTQRDTAIATKQNAVTTQSPIAISNDIIYFEDSGVTPATYGAQNESDGTLVPILRVDRFGRVIGATTCATYPPIDSGATGQYWKSDGSGRGAWASPAQVLTDSPLAIPSSKAILDYVNEGAVTILQYQGIVNSLDDIPETVENGWFFVAGADFQSGLTYVHHGDWLVYNHDTEDYDSSKWYYWTFGQNSAQSVNGYRGDIVLRASDITVTVDDTRTVSEAIATLEESIGDLNTLETDFKANLVGAINELAQAKQNNLTAVEPLVIEENTTDPDNPTLDIKATFDNEPTEDSINFLNSGAIYAETYPDVKAFDSTGTEVHDTKIVHLTKQEYQDLLDNNLTDPKTYYHIINDAGDTAINLLAQYVPKFENSSNDWDTTPVASSNKPVTSNGIYQALQEIRNAAIQIVTTLPVIGTVGTIYYLYDSVTQGYNTYIWDDETDTYKLVGAANLSITMDAMPISGSSNAVTSGGIYSATYNAVKAFNTNGSGKVNQKIVCLTQEQYDALDTPDENTLYFI